MSTARSAVIIGQFAMRRDFFYKIGGFDEGMELWGGENLDLPVRVSKRRFTCDPPLTEY